MSLFLIPPIQGPGRGVFPATISGIRVTAQVAVTAGKIYQLDLDNTDAAVTTFTPGAAASAFSNIVAPTAAGLKTGILGVAEKTVADTEQTTLTIMGIVDATVDGSGATAGNTMVATTAAVLSTTVATGQKIIARAMATLAANATGAVWFNGAGMFGTADLS